MNTLNSVRNSVSEGIHKTKETLPSITHLKSLMLAGIVSVVSGCSTPNQSEISSFLKGVGIAPKTDVEKRDMLFDNTRTELQNKGLTVDMEKAGNTAIYYMKSQEFSETNGQLKKKDICKQRVDKYVDSRLVAGAELNWDCVTKAK